MIMVIAALCAALIVPLTGGHFAQLAHVNLSRVYLVWMSLALQMGITVVSVPEGLGRTVHLVSYALSAFFVWTNRKLPGALVMGAGGGMNLLAIVANGGTMPADPRAYARAGFEITGVFENSNVVASPHLKFLGDIFAIPKGWPFANVFSIGDVVAAVGLTWFFYVASRPRVTAEPPAIAAV